MGTEELKTFGAYTKPLEKQDKVKAQHLLEAGKYGDVMQYMLEHNVKLEQEIVAMNDPGFC